MSLSIDTSFLTDRLSALVQINSVNPSLVPGAPGEAAVAEYVQEELSQLGLDVQVHEEVAGRPSVVGRLPGTGSGRSLMLNAHYDTVGVDGMEAPFSGDVKDDRVYGRGAYDMKGSLAANLAAVKALQDANIGLAGDLLVAAVADEEYESIGTTEVLAHHTVDAAIVTEPTDLDLCVAHKGFVWLDIETRGRAAHGSRPDLGVDANMHMGRVLQQLERLGEELRTRPRHRFVGHPSLHAALLQGGSAASVYASSCRLTVERRTTPRETDTLVVREVENLLDALRAEDPEFEAVLAVTVARGPFEVSLDSPIVKCVERSIQTVTGEEPIHCGQGPWMDSALTQAAGVDTVVIGPAGAGAHAPVEWVDLRSAERIAAILAEAALDYCG